MGPRFRPGTPTPKARDRTVGDGPYEVYNVFGIDPTAGTDTTYESYEPVDTRPRIRVYGCCYEAAALDDVCTRAGVTKGGLFHHFESKEQLAAAAIERFYGQLVDKGRHAMGAAPTDPAQLLWHYLDAVVALFQDPLLSRGCLLGAMALQTPQTHPAVAAAAQTALEDWKATLTELIAAAARHRAVSVDAGGLADGLLAAIEGGLLLDRDKPTNPAAVAAVTHFGRYLRLLLTQGATQ